MSRSPARIKGMHPIAINSVMTKIVPGLVAARLVSSFGNDITLTFSSKAHKSAFLEKVASITNAAMYDSPSVCFGLFQSKVVTLKNVLQPSLNSDETRQTVYNAILAEYGHSIELPKHVTASP